MINFHTVNVCITFPVKESISLIIEPLVETKILLPSGLNFKPVHSIFESLKSLFILKLEKGP